MNELIDRQAAINALENDKASLDHIIRGMSAYDVRLDAYVSQRNQVNCDIYTINNLPAAQPEITLLQATKTALEFIELCGGTTAFLITPDGEKLSCDWGYVEEGLRELVRYAERRTE